MKGKIYPKDTLFLRMHAGTAKHEKKEYELSSNMGSNTPIVRSEQSGKWFCLSWQDILDMAIDAGIDKKDTPKRKRKK